MKRRDGGVGSVHWQIYNGVASQRGKDLDKDLDQV